MGELATLSKQVSIKHLIINKKTWDSRELKHLLEEVKETNTQIVDSSYLSELKIGESMYKFLIKIVRIMKIRMIHQSLLKSQRLAELY